MKDKGVVQGECPYDDAPKRRGGMNTHECAKRYAEKTNDGTILPTKTEQRAINIDCASVS